MMADKDAAPTFNPKHRILGAVIVVSLAVILVPIILDRSEPPSELQSPSAAREAKPGETRVVVTPVAELATPSARPGNQPVSNPSPPPVVAAKPVADPLPPAAKPEPVAEKPVVEPLPAKPAGTAEPVREEPAKPAAKPETKKDAKADTKKAEAKKEKLKKGWVVQVGVYSNTDNANRMIARLKELGVKVNSETITLSGSKATRLRVGPYADRATAEKQQARIQKDLGEKVAVIAWP
jgi:DedD protein